LRRGGLPPKASPGQRGAIARPGKRRFNHGENMLSSVRSFLTSKFGAAIGIGFLVLIALAFASGDVSSVGNFGGVAGGDRVASVGEERIDSATLNQAATSALESVKQQNPTMSMKGFIADGGLDDVLDRLIDRLAIAAFGRENGIVASDRLIDSEITSIPAFKGPDGKFSDQAFRQMMQQRGISEQSLRDDLSQGLIARQVMLPAAVGAQMPARMALRYAALLSEIRTGEVAVLPSALFRPQTPPSESEIAAYYANNQKDFIRPERRVIRFARFGLDALGKAQSVTEAEIAARYKADAAQYAAQERRGITQVVVPTEAAAKALAAEVAGGASLEAAARGKGLVASKLAALSREEMTGQFSAALASAVYAAPRGGLAAPARSGLGWHVARVEAIDSRPARALDQVRGEIAAVLTQQKQRAAVTTALEEIEAEVDGGGSLVEVAKMLKAEVTTTAPLTADGRVYLKPGEAAPPILATLLETAFAMDVESPQLAEIEQGKTFVVFDVTEITESAPAPLKEIKPEVTAALAISRASVRAREAARQVQAAMAKGQTMAQALAGLGRPLPPPQPVRMSRTQLVQMQQGGQVPPPIALLFNMAERTSKVQPGPNRLAWFVVSLKDIAPGTVKPGDPIVSAARQQLGTMLGTEYSDALGRSIRETVGVERNPAAIRAVREQLGGES
jgi:peptidyl-prolyl cis-trans isomerase D